MTTLTMDQMLRIEKTALLLSHFINAIAIIRLDPSIMRSAVERLESDIEMFIEDNQEDKIPLEVYTVRDILNQMSSDFEAQMN